MAKLAVRWTKIALTDIENAFEFIANEDKPDAARKVIAKVLSGVEQVRTFPESGRLGRVEGTRELVIVTTPFIVVYRQKKGSIEVLAVLHHAKRWS